MSLARAALVDPDSLQDVRRELRRQQLSDRDSRVELRRGCEALPDAGARLLEPACGEDPVPRALDAGEAGLELLLVEQRPPGEVGDGGRLVDERLDDRQGIVAVEEQEPGLADRTRR